ncbi:MAG: hypothetical protein KDL87_05910 [Verrucomicrobiae bacterium]|nr:hypothetical protein [Verrucomicrobiae bacterium]
MKHRNTPAEAGRQGPFSGPTSNSDDRRERIVLSLLCVLFAVAVCLFPTLTRQAHQRWLKREAAKAAAMATSLDRETLPTTPSENPPPPPSRPEPKPTTQERP